MPSPRVYRRAASAEPCAQERGLGAFEARDGYFEVDDIGSEGTDIGTHEIDVFLDLSDTTIDFLEAAIHLVEATIDFVEAAIHGLLPEELHVGPRARAHGVTRRRGIVSGVTSHAPSRSEGGVAGGARSVVEHLARRHPHPVADAA